MKSTYSEPTTLWRLSHPDGRTARSVVIPQSYGASVLWFVQETLEGAQDFSDWQSAVVWCDSVRATLSKEGWTDASPPLDA